MSNIVWNAEEIKIITRIQKDELRNTWLHNKMYEVLVLMNIRLGWMITLLGLAGSILGFLLASIQDNAKWQYSGGIVSGIVGLLVSFLSRQSDRLNLSSIAEHHRLIAASHSGLYDDITLMKVKPTILATLFLQEIKITLKTIRDNSANLDINNDIHLEWINECKKRGIQEHDTFDQFNTIVQSMNDSTITTTVIDNTNNTNNTNDDFEDVTNIVNLPNDQQLNTQQPNGQQLNDQQPNIQKYQTLRRPKDMRGYDNKKLVYELDRLKEW